MAGLNDGPGVGSGVGLGVGSGVGLLRIQERLKISEAHWNDCQK